MPRTLVAGLLIVFGLLTASPPAWAQGEAREEIGLSMRPVGPGSSRQIDLSVVRKGGGEFVRLGGWGLVVDLPAPGIWRSLAEAEGLEPTPVPDRAPRCDRIAVSVTLTNRPQLSRASLPCLGPDPLDAFAERLARTALASDRACARLGRTGRSIWEALEACVRLRGSPRQESGTPGALITDRMAKTLPPARIAALLHPGNPDARRVTEVRWGVNDSRVSLLVVTARIPPEPTTVADLCLQRVLPSLSFTRPAEGYQTYRPRTVGSEDAQGVLLVRAKDAGGCGNASSYSKPFTAPSPEAAGDALSLLSRVLAQVQSDGKPDFEISCHAEEGPAPCRDPRELLVGMSLDDLESVGAPAPCEADPAAACRRFTLYKTGWGTRIEIWTLVVEGEGAVRRVALRLGRVGYAM